MEGYDASHRRQCLPEVDRRRGRAGLRRLAALAGGGALAHHRLRLGFDGTGWGTICKSQKTSTVTYIVLRSGSDELDKWITERRNVVEDFRKIYGETPDNFTALSLGIDSDDTRSSAESFIGPIVFTRP